MATDSTGDSKIVTKLLLNTCRLLQPSKHHVLAAEACVGIVTCTPIEEIIFIRLSSAASVNLATQQLPEAVEMGLIPRTTGSIAEFYIQPMLPFVGDIDIMLHNRDELAIPQGYPPPSQLPAEFDSRVKVYEIIDSEYPGYVYLMLSYLLTENTDADNYDAVRYAGRQYKSYDELRGTEIEINGPAHTIMGTDSELSFDAVICIPCLSWPIQAADWSIRHRKYDWPDSATVDRVVSNGCDVVRVTHHLCRQYEWMNKHQCRLSFSRAEIALLNSWTPVQQIVYHMLRHFMKTTGLTELKDSTGAKILRNYHIKTLMLWACESNPKSWWIGDLNVVRICVNLLHRLADWFLNANFPHYFVHSCNLIETPIAMEMMDILKTHLVSVTESWLSTWFVDNYLRTCADFCPSSVSQLLCDLSTSMKLQNAVSAVVDWRQGSALHDFRRMCEFAELHISDAVHAYSLTVRSCYYWLKELAKIDSCLCIYFSAFAFKHVAYKAGMGGLTDELIDVLATLVGHFIVKGRYSNYINSALSVKQAVKLMEVVRNKSRSTVQLIEIELAKAYLYRALRCKDSDSDSIYCLANAFLTVLYNTTGPDTPIVELLQQSADELLTIYRQRRAQTFGSVYVGV